MQIFILFLYIIKKLQSQLSIKIHLLILDESIICQNISKK